MDYGIAPELGILIVLFQDFCPGGKVRRFFFQNFFPHQTRRYRKIGFGGSYLSQWWKPLDVWNPQLSNEKDPVGWAVYGIILPSDIGSIINKYNYESTIVGYYKDPYLPTIITILPSYLVGYYLPSVMILYQPIRYLPRYWDVGRV